MLCAQKRRQASGSPATALISRGAPLTAHSGACGSAMDATTVAGEPRACTPATVALMVYAPGALVL
jgi:hypothetical protein